MTSEFVPRRIRYIGVTVRHDSTGKSSSGIAGLTAVLLAVVLVGCVASKPAPQPHATVLLSVVMEGRVPTERQPAGILLGVDEQLASGGRQFAFAPNTRIPGHYTTFLARLELPPGKHHLTRLAGVAGNGAPAPEFDVVLDLPFEVKARETGYLGHLEWSYGSDASNEPHLVLADAYEDDLPGLVHAWPALRGHSLARHASAQIVSVRAELRDPTALANSRTHGEGSPQVARLDLGAATGLPHEAQPAFRVFLTKAYPRAFAVTDSGQVGMAVGGNDVIRHALRNCKLKLSASSPRVTRSPPSRKSTCRLFAVDDTLTQ
jgi:hypothetical protein